MAIEFDALFAVGTINGLGLILINLFHFIELAKDLLRVEASRMLITIHFKVPLIRIIHGRLSKLFQPRRV